MSQLEVFYDALLVKVGVHKPFRVKFVKLVRDMIEATVLMPLGYAFKVAQGMKSGWGATANDNTLMHEFVFRCIMKRICWMKHLLYGDDNLILVPDGVTDEQLVAEYRRFGLVVKVIHSSRYLGNVDFLSKYVKYCDGNYYVFRPAIESHARMLMPEEMDPRRRDRPDAIIATERLLGHLLDNPFNKDVREVCYDLLSRMKKDYGVEYVTVHDGMMKKHPWRTFDPGKIPKQFPTVPSMGFIEELYGVPIPTHLKVTWPCNPYIIPFDTSVREVDSVYYDTANGFSNDVAFKLNELASRQTKTVVRKLSPYKQPTRCYGFHAARFEFAIKYFGIRFNNMLDLGSHPGACAASALKYCDSVVCVSKKTYD
jgi:hypothetical protein